jgi:probable F420-dependent oxidoreductase
MGTMENKLNSYILPGRVTSPLAGLDQAREGERIGIGGIWLSERWESKELGSVLGALTQITSRVKLFAGLTHFGTRHPLVAAGMGSTMQMLSGGRFVLGFARGIPHEFRKLGIPVFNNAGMADYAGILRKLWAGETVTYSGPAGEYPSMQLAQGCPNPPPIILGAIGVKTLALAGAHFDGVVLHPFLTTEGVARSAGIVRKAAEEAGRDPAKITIYTTTVTAPDTLSDAQRANILEARAVSYFMHREVGGLVVAMNGWDEGPMNRLIEKGMGNLDYGQVDVATARRMMAEAAALLPREWLETGAAVGSLDNCARRFAEYLDAGADEILLHGTTPDQQEEIVQAVRRRG